MTDPVNPRPVGGCHTAGVFELDAAGVVRGTFSIAGFYELREERLASAKIYREGTADIA
jgi:hypothetical protein